MKKLSIIVISAVLCMGLALPAMAEVTVGGLITMDVYNYSIDDPTGATNGNDTTQFMVYLPLNYIRVKYVNAEKTYGGVFNVYAGRANDTSTGDTSGIGQLSGANDMGGDSYVWWKPMPKLQLKIGTIPQLCGGDIGPPTHLKGHGIIVLITYGNLHTSGRQGISAHYKINDMVSLEVGAYDPDDDATPAIAGLGTGEELKIPRIDFSIPIKTKVAGASIFVQPKGSFLTKSYDEVAAGDDSFTVTTMGFDSQVTFGPVKVMFELDICKNLAGGDSYVSGLLGPAYAAGTITDSEATMFWFGVNYTINPKTQAAIFYGSHESEQGTLALTGRSSYGVRVQYHFAANWIIFPHFQIFQGHDTEIGGVNFGKGAKATQMGVNFYLVF
jgi:hypothetical protein